MVVKRGPRVSPTFRNMEDEEVTLKQYELHCFHTASYMLTGPNSSVVSGLLGMEESTCKAPRVLSLNAVDIT